jgi:hypothetical protein
MRDPCSSPIFSFQSWGSAVAEDKYILAGTASTRM